MSKEDAIEYFEECVAKDHIFEDDLTLEAMKSVLIELEKLQKDSILNEKVKELGW